MTKAVELDLMNRSRLATAMNQAGNYGNGLVNLLSIGSKRDITSYRFCRPVVIAGAGPSLTQHLEVIESLVVHGWQLWSAPTAAWALVKGGVPPHMIVDLEAMPLEHPEGVPICASAWAHTDTFDAAEYAFLDAHPSGLPAAQILGTYPVEHGGSALTAAVFLANLKRAPKILLVGADLAYPDGKAYADGTPWEDFEAKLDGDALVWKNTEARQELTRKNAGWYMEPKTQCVPVAAYAGGEVPSDVSMVGQLRWLEWFARAEHHSHLRYIPGAARIAGWEPDTGIPEWQEVEPYESYLHTRFRNADDAIARLLIEAQAAAETAKKPLENIEAMAAGFPYISQMAAGVIMRRFEDLPKSKKDDSKLKASIVRDTTIKAAEVAERILDHGLHPSK